MLDCARCFQPTPPGASCRTCGASPLLDDRYALQTIIGEGAQGTTYRARRVEDGSTVAVKELVLRKASSWKAVAQLEREAATLQAIDHPAVPSYHESFTIDFGRAIAFYLVQDYVDGKDLSVVGGLDGYQALSIAAVLLDILADLHERPSPVIHRDVKPANVVRRSEGGLALVDFGSVRSAQTMGSTIAGTFGYMAPEQLAGRAVPESDVYGAGATLVALLSGRDPAELWRSGRLDWRGVVNVAAPVGGLLDDLLAPEAEDRPSARQAAQRCRQVRRAVGRSPAMVRPTGPPHVEGPDATSLQTRDLSADTVRKSTRGGELNTAVALGCAAVGGPLIPLLPHWLNQRPFATILMMIIAIAPLIIIFRRHAKKKDALLQVLREGERVSGRIIDATIESGRMRYSYLFRRQNSPDRPCRGEFVAREPLPLSKGSTVTIGFLPERPEVHTIVAIP